MSIKGKISNGADANLQLSFDVGHSSIGWAVLEKTGAQANDINILGCGSVIFRADDCLASSRRAYRRQRRHIRSTRQRIARMKILLQHLGVLTEAELNPKDKDGRPKPGCAWPWKLAAQILQGGKLLTWPELWDVLRWYAHNRGYDGNRRWSAAEFEAQNEDTEKEANANSLLDDFKKKYGRDGSMAEVFCDLQNIFEPVDKFPSGKLSHRKSANLSGDKRPKGQNAAFPRPKVENEVRKILQAHFGKLKGVDEKLERALLGKDSNDKTAWQEIPCPDLKLPKRYEGGLLFGQLVPRFDNRIISTCPISGEKVPSRNCPEFLNFRWAMQLANIQVGKFSDQKLKPLQKEHRAALDKLMRERGYLTPTDLKKAVREFTGCERDNLDTMLMHPDAKEALLVDPVQKLISSDELQSFWNLFSERLQKRLRGQWRRGKSFSLAQIRRQFESLGGDAALFDAELQKQLDAQNTKAKKKDKQTTREELLQKHFPSRPLKLDGRAAFARPLLKQAYDEVLAGKHPKEEDGCLFIDEKIRDEQLNRAIAEQTNNHLVRHRLLILAGDENAKPKPKNGLLQDIIKEYADGKKERVGKITIEVNRDLREMSGKTAKEKAQDLGLRIANHHAVAEKLEKAFAEEGIKQPITAGLIRKARIAEDLGWRCPYTGQPYEPKHLVTRFVDKDHIVPRSERASDSLDSLVITFSEINKWKGKRTAIQFVTDEQGKRVPNLNYEIMGLTRYKQFVESLESYKGHDDDKRRKKKRKELMLLPKYEEKEFTPRDLTQTSQLVRLGAQVLRKNLPHLTTGDVTSLPGSVTGTVRKNWKLEGCLSAANSQVLDETGNVKSKTDIRDITHLHHALDACVLGIATNYFRNQKLGAASLWELLVKRKYNEQEKTVLRALGIFQFDEQGNSHLQELPEELKKQIRRRLSEKRVVQHIPARMDGLRVEQNIWRVVVKNEDKTVLVRQRIRQPDGSRKKKEVPEKDVKLLGLVPLNGVGKLAANKGVLVIPDNYGVAILDHAEDKKDKLVIIPWHLVHKRIFTGFKDKDGNELEKSLLKRNGGKMPRILRNGQLVQVGSGTYKGAWKITSIKNQKSGVKVNLAQPDTVNTEVEVFDEVKQKKIRKVRPDCRHEASLETILSGKLEIIDLPFTGFAIQPPEVKEPKQQNAV